VTPEVKYAHARRLAARRAKVKARVEALELANFQLKVHADSLERRIVRLELAASILDETLSIARETRKILGVLKSFVVKR
jgi:hypothetical protein